MDNYYDDNFGRWENTDDPEMVEFYHQVQAESVLKECQGCGEKVQLRKDYAYCNWCAEVC